MVILRSAFAVSTLKLLEKDYMRFDVLTIFPELISEYSRIGLLGKAVASDLLKINPIQLRDYAVNDYGQIDDSPYGGGSGMVLKPEPALAAITAAKKQNPNSKVILFTPRGQVFNQTLAKKFVKEHLETGENYILLCCRYEGVDERVVQSGVDYEISLGDFVLMGAELASMVFMETLSRLLPGVLGNPDSIKDESFENNFLEYPQYTKPAEFQGKKVPDVLLSGHHQEIEKWRRNKSYQDTLERRPDLFEFKHLPKAEINVALIHYPVLNKRGEVIASSITTIDVHDISRSAATYGIANYYVVHPTKVLRMLNEKICKHWQTGYGSTYNPNRKEALAHLKILADLDDVIFDIEQRTGKLPKIITTSAKDSERSIRFLELKKKLYLEEGPFLILLGTGWGMTEELLNRADYHLEPIKGLTEYNHLSVRSAAAIIFDRLLGKV